MRPLINNLYGIHSPGMYVSKRKRDEKHTAETVKPTQEEYQQLIDLKRNRNRLEKAALPLYRNIGFTITFLLLILVFNWKVEEQAIVELGVVEAQAEIVYDIPISKQTPPPPPKATEVYKIVEVENTLEVEKAVVNIDIEATESTELQEVAVTIAEEVEEEVSDEIFIVVEESPEPVGGQRAFLEYLAANIRYPKAAARLNISGRVFVQFVVEKDGSLTDIKVVKGIGAGCDEEAIRVLSEAPKWNPGKQRGMPVRVSKLVPILFVLKEQ